MEKIKIKAKQPLLETLWPILGHAVRKGKVKGKTLVGSCPVTSAWNKPGTDKVAARKRALTTPDQPLGRLQQALSGATSP